MGLELRTGTYGDYWGSTWGTSAALNMTRMQVNAIYIYSALSAAGWTMNAVAGVLGNMQSESAINPGRWQNDNPAPVSPSGIGYGLCQWTPYTKYTEWVTGDPSTMDNNLSRILYEVANNIQWGNDAYGNPPPYNFYQFTQSTEDPYTLGMNFVRYYEKPQTITPSRRNTG